ncbi:MAG: hypothetical protein ACLVB5_01885 [Christensenellales bacterium]
MISAKTAQGQTGAAQRRTDQLAVAQRISQQNDEQRGLAREHRNASADARRDSVEAERSQQRWRRATNRRARRPYSAAFCPARNRLLEYQAAAQGRPAGEARTRAYGTPGGDGAFRRAEQAQQRRGEKKPPISSRPETAGRKERQRGRTPAASRWD